jgi:SAM-dependent methyltransferase
MSQTSATEIATPPDSVTAQTLPDPRVPRYFPPSFVALLNAGFGGGVDEAICREYFFSEIERGREIAGLIRPWTSLDGKSVLDIGCGYGGLLIAMKEAGATRLTGVEIETDRLHWAGVRMRELGYEADLRKLDICEEQTVTALDSYDVILAQDVLEHVAVPSVAIGHIVRLLRPGGVVFMQVGNKFSPEQLAGDHHYRLPGITMLSRPQAIEYFCTRLKQPVSNYAVGSWREEKYYRHVFRRWGVALHRVDHFPTTDHVLWYAKAISELCAKLQAGDLWPDLRPELSQRMRRRILKLVALYVHACQQLPRIANDPALLAAACDAIVGRLLWGVWRLVGVKNLADSNMGSPRALQGTGR